MAMSDILIIAEIGINHDGNFEKALQLVEAAYRAGAKCVKFQCHVVDDEYIPAARDVIPGNAKESIYAIMERCAFSEEQDRRLKAYVESLGMLYLSTPFSRAAADRLQRMGVKAFKIGSGECNNYPLIRHINGFGKPIILSTGMNTWESIKKATDLLTVPYALLHCVSMYPTPYSKVHLPVLRDMQERYPNTPIGLSDHSIGIATSLAAIALGARIVEKHFTVARNWPGPDNCISILPNELHDLIVGADAISKAMTGVKEILPEEQSTINFAYASVVTIKPIDKGEPLTMDNIWVKRPGGGIPAEEYDNLLGKRLACAVPADVQLDKAWIAKDRHCYWGTSGDGFGNIYSAI
jgi:sialic acid synthase SpsE